MKNDRIGEDLWYEWSGELYDPVDENSIVYYTFDHVSTDNELVKRALASALQRDGIADSLGKAFQMIEVSSETVGWVGCNEDDVEYIVCDEKGETYYGDSLEDVKEITFVEFYLD